MVLKGPPTIRLQQLALAKELDRGRNPVREAFSVLEEMGLMRSLGNAGSIVVSATNIELEAIIPTRLMLETIACEQVALYSSKDEKRRILDHHQKMVVESRGAERTIVSQRHYYALDYDFHLLIASLSGMEFIVSTLGLILDKLRVLALQRRATPKEVLEEHYAIVKALCRPRPDEPKLVEAWTKEIRRAVFDHMRGTASRWAPTCLSRLDSLDSYWGA